MHRAIYSLLFGKSEQCSLEMLNLHVPGFTGGLGGRGQGGGGNIWKISSSWIVPHTQLEPHQPIQDTHSVELRQNINNIIIHTKVTDFGHIHAWPSKVATVVAS